MYAVTTWSNPLVVITISWCTRSIHCSRYIDFMFDYGDSMVYDAVLNVRVAEIVV